MDIFFLLWYIFQAWIAIYLALPFIFLVVYFFKKSTGTLFNIHNKKTTEQKEFDFGVIITVHRETHLVPALIDSLLKQRYPSFQVYVVADRCEPSSILSTDQKITVLTPGGVLDSKIKSIQFAIDNFSRQHDAVVILDSDNLVHPDFLFVFNQYFKKGYKAVQANLQPKNADSMYARLDSMGNAFYNFTEREMRMELGLSSAIWGLGIAIDTELYKEIVYQNHFGGFDKRMQAFLVCKVNQLAYAKEAIVYDEKVNSGQALETQRTRWIHAYFRYFQLNWGLLWHGIKKFRFNPLLFGFLNLRPPFFILIFLVLISCVVNYYIHIHLFIAWMVILVLFFFSFTLIVSLKTKDKKTVKSILFLPYLIMRQVFALVKLKKAGKTFLKTEHSKLIYIEDLIGK